MPLMELDPRRLRVLRAVALRGGVVDAAKVLHLTPSAVSQHLAQLEREVGRPLVDRSRRRAGLTPAGRLLAARAERIEHELAEARRELAELTGRATGPVAVAAFSSAVCHLLVPALAALARTHPGLEPRVIEAEGPDALRELRTGGLDVLVVEYDGADPDPDEQWRDLASTPVADDEYRVITPADWSPPPRSVRDLAERPWVAAPSDTACGRALERISAEYGFTARRAHVGREFPTVLALVRAGLGAAVVPTLALAGAPAETIALPSAPVAGHRRVAAVHRASRTGPEPLIAAVTDALRKAAVDLGLTPTTPG